MLETKFERKVATTVTALAAIGLLLLPANPIGMLIIATFAMWGVLDCWVNLIKPWIEDGRDDDNDEPLGA